MGFIITLHGPGKKECGMFLKIARSMVFINIVSDNLVLCSYYVSPSVRVVVLQNTAIVQTLKP
jgi:hypothetical protein